MNNTLKKIWSVTSTVLVVVFVLCAIFLMGSRIVGYQCYTVLSGSMEPNYSVGDLLYVKDVDVNTIEVGDPITFILNEDLVVATHRVVRIDAENQRFYTKGDANEIEDSEPVHFNNVIGVPQFSIPKLGYVSDFVQNPPGMYITIAVFVVLIAIVFLPDLIGKKKQEDETQADTATTQTELSETAAENERLKAEIERLKAESAPHYSSGELTQLGSQNKESE